MEFLRSSSLSSFFADGFVLATSSPGADTHQSQSNEERLMSESYGGITFNKLSVMDDLMVEAAAGVKRERSSLVVDKVSGLCDTTAGRAHDESSCENAALLPLTSNSLYSLHECGSWVCEKQQSDSCEATVAAAKVLEGDEQAHELSAVLQEEILRCYKVEDELQQWKRQRCVDREYGEWRAPQYGKVEAYEDIRGARPLDSCKTESGQYPGPFMQMVNQVRAQKLKHSQQSERLEKNVRDIARAKELPLLVADAVHYAAQIMKWRSDGDSRPEMVGANCNEPYHEKQQNPHVNSTGACGDYGDSSQMLYAKYPPPLFHGTSFAGGVRRLIRWIGTWQQAPLVTSDIKTRCRNGCERYVKRGEGCQNEVNVQSLGSQNGTSSRGGEGGTGTVATSRAAGEPGQGDRQRRILQEYHNRWIRMASSYLDGSCVTAVNPHSGRTAGVIGVGEYGLLDGQAVYDTSGNRLRSVRLARKMAEERTQREEIQRMREQRRGYFAREDNKSGRSLRRATTRDDIDDDIYVDEANYDEEDNVTNIAVLHGPCGVGKTAMVYLAAAVLGYRVVEMNTAVRRCPQNVDRLLSEVTRSRSLSVLAAGKGFVSIEEELKKLKAESANAAVSTNGKQLKVSTPPRTKKPNAISAKAIEDFFRPRLPANQVNIVNEDGDVIIVAGAGSGESQCTDQKQDEQGDKRKPVTNSHADDAAVTTSLVAANGHCGSEETARTLLLIEDADVLLGDEAGRSFYAAVRDLSERSKVPIVVTVSSTNQIPTAVTSTASGSPVAGRLTGQGSQENETLQIIPMSAAQAAQYFGKRTPFSRIESMSHAALFVQLLVVAMVERGLLSVGTHINDSEMGCSEVEREGLGDANDTEKVTHLDGDVMVFRKPVVVSNVTMFRRIANAIRAEIYGSMENGAQYQTPCEHVDVRFWLNRLQYLLLQEQWPSADARERAHEGIGPESSKIRHEHIGEVDKGIVPHFLPTHLFAKGDSFSGAAAASEWDTRLGRALQAPLCALSPVATCWEWQQFQYADEVNAAGSAGPTVIGGGCVSSSSIADRNCEGGESSMTEHGAGAGGVVGGGGGSNSSASQIQCYSDEPLREGSNRALEAVGLFDILKKVPAPDGARGRSTTKERIDAFGRWWRRKQKTHATKLYVASRSDKTYADVIGYSCLLQHGHEETHASGVWSN
ncbi:hypothetical protein TRVL_02665 [Trypanosoma vivax]|uniref:ATPase AAA-type core domain-containing protein n=1 Tax=Trypanosoma vivax (strain Y486) TaxID=1055687 RepID=G0TR75_TRYVY|nr:hypothetical protein TRVL_02665 [Trypanosoma vivax]CCC46439.1 conserved hypothetical protein [Trypanosoma vivax Y486]